MAHTVLIDKSEKTHADKALLLVIAFLVLLGGATLVSFYIPEWLNFMWLSIATLSIAAVSGWLIGFLLDILFEEVN